MNLDSKTVTLGIWLTAVFLLGSWLVGNQPVEVQVNVPEVEEKEFGGTRFPSGISADSTFPSAGQVRGTTLTVTNTASISGETNFLRDTEVVSADNTLAATESGLITFVSASGSTTTLPSASAGLYFKFVVGAAFDTFDFRIDSAEGDNIYGTLSVNNADVACSAEDQINFIADGETVGDNVELVSDGTSWFIVGSEAETAAKLTCTDPT